MQGYNIWCKWHPLRSVMLGDCYHPEYFRDIKNDRIRAALETIAAETVEDLDNFQKVLGDYGATVLRPKINPHANIMDMMNDQGQVKGMQGVPRSPLQPRDAQLVIGNQLYTLHNDHHAIMQELQRYDDRSHSYVNLILGLSKAPDDVKKRMRCISRWRWQQVSKPSWGSYDDYVKLSYFDELDPAQHEEVLRHHITHTPAIDAASMTLVGRDLYIDYMDGQGRQHQPLDPMQLELITQHADLRINGLSIGGHNDGCFHTLKPGAILSLHDIQDYADTFPGWDVCFLPNQSWAKMSGFMKIKDQVKGKWWVPGQEDNHEFTHFVETWLQDWVGYAEESVFDVNVLMLDESHVCVSNYNATAFEFFKKHKIEPIIVPWRHRYFWDGGLHCITLDLNREGTQEDYFPQRQAPVFDQGL